MKKGEKASISLRKMLVISLLFVISLGTVAVVAGNTELNSVTIRFSNNHEITVLTSRTNVAEILADNRIMLAANEEVVPGLDADITDSRIIEIFITGTRRIEAIELAEQSDENIIENIIQRHTNMSHKIVIVREEIPFETIFRDVSNSDGPTDNRIIEIGRVGLRDVKYKITYHGDVEIARLELEYTIVRNPINRIIQVQSRPTTRGGTRHIYTSGIFRVTAYCICSICCGPYAYTSPGITASGTRATAGRTIAAPPRFPFGTQMRFNGNVYIVEDRGGAIQGNTLDLFVDCHQEAIRWGVRYVYVEVLF